MYDLALETLQAIGLLARVCGGILVSFLLTLLAMGATLNQAVTCLVSILTGHGV